MTKPLAFIVEDDLTIVTVFEEALKAADYETEIFSNGQAVLDRLEETIPAIMILDIHLPKVSGKDILLYIRSNERLEDMRVIIVSADAALAESLRGEADLVLTKPISFHQLRELSARLRP